MRAALCVLRKQLPRVSGKAIFFRTIAKIFRLAAKIDQNIFWHLLHKK